MADSQSQEATEVDPRKALAERYLQRARAELAAKEGDHAPGRPRDGDSPGPIALSEMRLQFGAATFLHFLLLLPLITFTGFALLWCYVLVNFNIMVGRAVLIPTGILTFITLSYASTYYLGLIESTSQGETTPEDALRGTWQDWFWMLPATVGMLAAAAGLGYLISIPFPNARWQVIGWAVLVLYPFLQLSSLESGNPFAPFSWPMFTTLFKRPLMWITVYAVTFGLAFLVAAVARAAWRDPPYFTFAVLGPMFTICLLIYGLLLGLAARWLSLKSG
jgi:hypothetical protein